MKHIGLIRLVYLHNFYKGRFSIICMQNYELLIGRIVSASGLPKDEIERKVEAKKAKLSGLISREGAAQIIAAELGVSFENIDVKISELMPGMRKVNVIGKIVQMFPIREFEKNGRSGKVANFKMGDETGSCRCVLWDMKHIEMLENGSIKEGDVISIGNGSTRDTEIHLSGFSELTKSDKVLENVKTEAAVTESDISSLVNGQNVQLRGLIVQMFPIRFYNVCTECNKKVTASADGASFTCGEHGAVTPKPRGILNFVLDDGTESVRCVLFSDAINKIGNEEEFIDEAKFEAFRKDKIGTEVYVSGNVRRNSFFNNLELIGNDVSIVDVDKLIAELEAKA
ncbi:MAG: replication factor A1 [Patescibacteria group bacterium]|jgi:replication factor A1